MEPSVFDVLNVFRSRWFLNRDHLIANVLSAQKAEDGRYTWVDFLPPFHTHLVQRARTLLPPLCPVAKGKKVLFVFILKILDGDRAQSGSFWEVPKKRRRRRPSSKPKKPEVTPGVAPVVSEKPRVSPIAAKVASAILKKPDRVEEDAMTGVEPSVPADPPPPPRITSTPVPTVPLRLTEARWLPHHPFPREFDRAKIHKWIQDIQIFDVYIKDFGALVRAAGHTAPVRLQHIQALVTSLGGLPLSTPAPPPSPFSPRSRPPPSLNPPLPHSLSRDGAVPSLIPRKDP